jgi:hypothetical protein
LTKNPYNSVQSRREHPETNARKENGRGKREKSEVRHVPSANIVKILSHTAFFSDLEHTVSVSKLLRRFFRAKKFLRGCYYAATLTF